MDIETTKKNTLTILSNMQCLRDVFRIFPKDEQYDNVVFKSNEQFYNYIFHIDQHQQEIIFSFKKSPVKMFISIENMKQIFENEYVYDLSTLKTEKLLIEVNKIIILEETIKYQIEKQTIENNKIIKRYELTIYKYKNKQTIKKFVDKYIEYLINDKYGNPPDYNFINVYKQADEECKTYIICKIINSFKESHLFLNSSFKKNINNNPTNLEIYKFLWLSYYH
jgi:hypothetical protein